MIAHPDMRPFIVCGGGEQYDIGVTSHSRQAPQRGVTDGNWDEVGSHFLGVCPKARQLIALPRRRKRWAAADREPIDKKL